MNNKIIASVFVVAILFVSLIALTTLYYNAQITKPNKEKAPTLEASLGIVEIQGKNSNFVGKPTNSL